MTGKQVYGQLEANQIFVDKVTKHRDGTYTAKRSFFYRHGQTATQLANKIKMVLPNAEILEAYEEHNNWPKDNYFVIKFRLA